MRLRYFLPLAVPAAVLAAMATVTSSSGQPPVDEAARVRCATRLSLSLTGRSPSAELLAATDPQAQVDALLSDDAFVERFLRFMNSELNPEPGETPAADATYFLARHILQNNRPWRELFDGAYRVVAVPAADGNPATAEVVDDPAGLGYFRSRPWNGSEVRSKLLGDGTMAALKTFTDRTLAMTDRNVVTVIMGDFSRSLPGSNHQANLTATVIGKYVKLGTTGRVNGDVGLPSGTPGIDGFWAYLAAVLGGSGAPFGANPHNLVLA